MEETKNKFEFNWFGRFAIGIKDNRIDVLIALALAVILYTVAYLFLGFGHSGLEIPFGYAGGDDFSNIVMTKLVGESGWFWFNDYTGAPYGNVSSMDFAANMLTNFDFLLIKIFYLFTNDAIIANNLRFLMIFPIAGVISYAVFRNLKLNYFFSAGGSAVFALAPYIFFRGVGHLVLSSCYFVPFSVLLCIWAMNWENDYLKFDRNFFRSSKNIASVIFAVLISNNGIGYYAFFTCFFLCVVAMCNLIDSRKIKSVLPAVKSVLLIGVLFVINILPGKIYNIANGLESIQPVRSAIEGEIYGLKIAQLFIPLSGHGIPLLERIIKGYNTYMPLVNENAGAYLGIAGICGFILTLLILFRSAAKKDDDLQLCKLSKMTVFGVLFATIGGFSSILSMAVNMIRGYNRISIFLLYICLTVLLICLQKVWTAMLNKNILKKAIYLTAVSLVFMVSIWDALPVWGSHDAMSDSIKSIYLSDKSFVEQIESELNDGAMVFQLPYHATPEAGPVNNMADYHLYTGYINSKTLKWSYGATKGRDGDTWNKNVASMAIKDMVNYITRAGFTGIYIDSRAYTAEALDELKHEIEMVIGAEPKYSENGILLFYNLTEYIRENNITLDEAVLDIQKIKYKITYHAPDSLFCVGNAEQTGRAITIRNGGVQFGPYCSMDAGVYTVSVHGDNLLSCTYDANSNSTAIETEELYSSNSLIVYKIILDGQTDDIEFRTFNSTDKDVIIRSICTDVFVSEEEVSQMIENYESEYPTV